MPPSYHSEAISDWLLLNNHQYIAFNKPNGLPVQDDRTGDASLHQLAQAYARQDLHLVHRIDRPISGVVLLAKKKSALNAINEQQQQNDVEKTYLAVVTGRPDQAEATLVHYLQQDGRRHRAVVADQASQGAKRSTLHYRTLAQGDHYSLLEITLDTGRFHQIRAQLAEAGHPLRGDVKYGARRANGDRSIDLHAWKLAFSHPVTGERISLVAPPPQRQPWAALLAMLTEEE